jgi:hypothetical protein
MSDARIVRLISRFPHAETLNMRSCAGFQSWDCLHGGSLTRLVLAMCAEVGPLARSGVSFGVAQ